MAKNIVELNIDGTSYTNRPFAICDDAAGTTTKSVDCGDFVLVPNATILVKFVNANEASQPTLNVNQTGDIPIKWNNSRTIGNKIKKGDVYEFIYDGEGNTWLCLGGMDINNAVTQIPTTSNIRYPLLMGTNPASLSDQITDAVRFHSDLTYNPSTQTLGLGVLNCTTSESNDNSNTIDLFANRQLPTTFRIGLPVATESTAPSTSINLAYSGPGMTLSEARNSLGLSIGPNVIDDTTTNGFLISTDKSLHIEGSSLSFGPIGSSIAPNQNDTYNLGTSSRKWNEVYATSFKGTADSARFTPYGVCSTAGATAAKTVTTSVPFVLETGARISVKFNNNNTASNMTLNVKSTGAKNVYLNGSVVGAGIILKDNIYDFIYDGSKWILQPGVDNRTGSSHSTSELFLIGATSQSASGVQTYSNSNVYTTGGAIYTKGGFYDMSTTAGASVHKAIVPKDYTENGGNLYIQGSHEEGRTLSTSISAPSPKFGGLVYQCSLTAGESTRIIVTPQEAGYPYETTLAISLTTDPLTSNFRFVRFLISVPVEVINNSVYACTFGYFIKIRLNGGTYRQTYQSYKVPGPVNNIPVPVMLEKLSIIYDLMKNTIINDTANGTTSWS